MTTMTKENKMKDDRIRPYIMIVEKYKLVPDLNMGYYSEFIYAEALSADGMIIPLNTEKAGKIVAEPGYSLKMRRIL